MRLNAPIRTHDFWSEYLQSPPTCSTAESGQSTHAVPITESGMWYSGIARGGQGATAPPLSPE